MKYVFLFSILSPFFMAQAKEKAVVHGGYKGKRHGKTISGRMPELLIDGRLFFIPVGHRDIRHVIL
jgi:hypothetical protein